ncbi:hypothetical protein [Ralstonia chuxiongensis]|uniref:Uncharacterized protein n=1 Tax=Ralstonia chuxiongensis TaxID=2957504 RepID=A0AA41WSE8_9RALS|nr:hypothetical protein [Ralstonia chuxiongensis]MCP1174325.1 hypothetical protein [Ralstonia chuxiongensis]
MEIVVRRSIWASTKLFMASVAMAAMFILVFFVNSLPFIVRASACVFGIVLCIGVLGLIVRLANGLPACIIRDDGILVPRFGFSRELSQIPWVMVQSAELIDLLPAGAPIGREGAFGQPVVRLNLTRRFTFGKRYTLLIGEANLPAGEIYAQILKRMQHGGLAEGR